MNKKQTFQIILAIVLCQGAGLLSAVSVYPNITDWYSIINKPDFTPPNWVFAPVWTTLYFLMGIALYKIWQKGIHTKKVKFATAFFFIHLLFNGIWSVLFFQMHEIFLALIHILVLDIMIVVSILLFKKIDVLAAHLLVPYLLWTTFATILNFAIWTLN